MALGDDVRLGFRRLRRWRGFTVLAALTLALGIGATTAIMSVVKGVLMEILPFENSQQLLMLRPRAGGHTTWSAYREILAWRERSRSFESIAAHLATRELVRQGDRSEAVLAYNVSANFFSMLRVEPLLGRTFTAAEDQPGSAGVAVLSYGFWQRWLGGRDDFLGETLLISDEPFEVIGVMKPGFVYPLDFRSAAVWIPLGRQRDETWGWNFETHYGIVATGRLRDGVSSSRAREDMDRISAELAEEQPATHRGRSVGLTRPRDRALGKLELAVRLLAVAGVVVLSISCVNVAALLLIRGHGRRHEMAVRSALGARRWQLLRQALSESVLLALLGAVPGLGVAFAMVRALPSVVDFETLPAFGEIEIDVQVLLFALAVALFTGAAFGLAPALWAQRSSAASLHGVRTSAGRGFGRFLFALVVFEIGLGLALTLCAVLAVGSFRRILGGDPGFDPENLLTLVVELPVEVYDTPEKQVRHFTELRRRLAVLPGVESVATSVPVVVTWASVFEVVGRPPSREKPTAALYKVSPGYFETMGLTLLEGRSFEESDRADAPGVVIVDRLFADTVWPGEEALGQRLWVGPDTSGPGREVVGVVAPVQHGGVQEEPWITCYQPAAQAPDDFATFLARTSLDPASLFSAARDAILAADAGVLVGELMTMEDRLAPGRTPQRLAAALLGVFALLGTLLAAVGVYSVVAYAAAQRRREMAVRMALGAQGADVRRLVLRRGLALASSGVVLGLALALVGTKLLESLLYATDPYAPGTWVGLCAFVVLWALLACAVPAWRTSRVEPAVVLRDE